MGILFLILKIIGFILLGLLAFSVLMLMAVLFVPVRYRVFANYDKGAAIRASAGWLLHVVAVSLIISGGQRSCRIKIFGIPVLDLLNPRKDPKKKHTKKEKQHKTLPDPKKRMPEEKTSQASVQQKPSQRTEPEQAAGPERKPEQKSEQTAEPVQKTRQQNSGQPTGKTTDGKTSFFQKVNIYASRISGKIKAARQRGCDWKSQCSKWITVLKRERTKEAVHKCKDTVCRVIKAVLPRRWKLFVHFGMEDPATTADILGYYWMFFAVVSGHIDCRPDFENRVLECSLQARGHIRMITMVIAGWKFLFDPDLIYLRNIKKEVDSL